MQKGFRKILYDFGNLLTNMSADAWISVVVSIAGIIGTASKIQTGLDRLTFVNDTLRSFVLYPLALVVSGVFYLFIAFVAVQALGNGFKKISRFRIKRRIAKIEFPIPPKGNELFLEIYNAERSLELEGVCVRLYSIKQIPDKFGKLPMDRMQFDNLFFGLSHNNRMEDLELALKEGGGHKSGEAFTVAKESVFFHLFTLSEYGEIVIPKINFRVKLPQGKYDFDFELECHVRGKRTPRYLSIVAIHNGSNIRIENIEPRGYG